MKSRTGLTVKPGASALRWSGQVAPSRPGRFGAFSRAPFFRSDPSRSPVAGGSGPARHRAIFQCAQKPRQIFPGGQRFIKRLRLPNGMTIQRQAIPAINPLALTGGFKLS